MANTIPYQTVWIKKYQDTFYKQAVFPMFADNRFENELVYGSTVKWSYDADMGVQRMPATGAYTIANRTVVDETLTVDQQPTATFNIPLKERLQDHRPTQEKWGQKAMNAIYQDIDAVVLNELRANAVSKLDAGDFGGSSGEPVTLSPSNAAAIFFAAEMKLRNQNVVYDVNYKFQNVIKFDSENDFLVAAIPAELRYNLSLSVAFKNTPLSDQVLKNGLLAPISGFNPVVSTSLPFSFRYTLSARPGNGTYLYLGSTDTTIGTGTGIRINWVTTIGSTPGNVLDTTSAAASMTNLVNLLNDPYGSSTANYVTFVRENLSIAQQRILDNISAVDNEDGSAVITIGGLGTVQVSQTSSYGTIDRRTVHAIFAVSKCISVIFQKRPVILESAGELVTTGALSGNVAKHYVVFTLYGKKVFLSQAKKIVDVQIDASAFSSPVSVLN